MKPESYKERNRSTEAESGLINPIIAKIPGKTAKSAKHESLPQVEENMSVQRKVGSAHQCTHRKGNRGQSFLRMSCLKNGVNATCKFAVISDAQAEIEGFLCVLHRISNGGRQWVSDLDAQGTLPQEQLDRLSGMEHGMCNSKKKTRLFL